MRVSFEDIAKKNLTSSQRQNLTDAQLNIVRNRAYGDPSVLYIAKEYLEKLRDESSGAMQSQINTIDDYLEQYFNIVPKFRNNAEELASIGILATTTIKELAADFENQSYRRYNIFILTHSSI